MSSETAAPTVENLGHFDRLVVGLNALGSLWILFLVLLVTTDAMGRSLFASPIAGVTELIQISIIGIVFLQLADAVRTHRLTRADSFLTLLHARRPRLAWRLEAAFLAMGAAYMVLGLWGSVPLLLESYERDEFMGNVGVFTVRVWPIKTIIVLGLIVTFIEFTRQAIAAWRRAPAP